MAVDLEREGGLAVLRLNRPEALNALSFAVLDEIGAALDAVAAMAGVRALLVTGAGEKAFCAGADIKELRHRSLAEQKHGAELGQAVFAKLDRLPVASVALVNGYAFGGGAELAMACTFRLAAPQAAFGLPEIKLGLIPGYGGTQRLPRLVGEARALELILTGRTVPAAEAERIGLVNAVAEGDLLEAGRAFAGRFTRYSLPVLELARRAVQRAGDTALQAGLETEADLSTLAYRTADAEEGMAAFEEKRKPEFRDG
ncbi:enoyl-CoA hydratase/isomerase family protein [Celeribacter indicus]|uniref:Short chain enoyl-CoA hydratase n=1 Tax=Celeribacter indicus TaxID=1208324 RepID=A0A0B5E6Y0_9RHOB|nr:enoyl-CoA hydratase-related protein [Celeribacter indicus]AJE49167.1 short chain enoyl-CoA hydratase [Celeribacter indicus]AJE49195.1 short chain enoyl-CoA hydratase [Celeribacter indicus]SDX17968.1 short chain enoyl-CoA hydratase [Celeribacter indicus]SDX18562.1 enoyl-CoA hydratase [Celeribacter indicus]